MIDYRYLLWLWLRRLDYLFGPLFLSLLFDPSVSLGLVVEFVLLALENDLAAVNDDDLRHIV